MNVGPAAVSHRGYVAPGYVHGVLGSHKALPLRGGFLTSQEILRRDLEVSLPAHYCSLMAILVFFPLTADIGTRKWL